MSQLLLDGMPEPVRVPPGTSDEFYTPSERFDPWHREFSFTLDVCATAESAKVPRFFTKEQDGLAQNWRGQRVWCNPPYSDIEPWVVKAHEEMCDGCELVAMLLPATKSEQPWWQKYVEPYRDTETHRFDGAFLMETRFLAKRIAFGYPGNPQGGNGSGWFPSVLVIWRAPWSPC